MIEIPGIDTVRLTNGAHIEFMSLVANKAVADEKVKAAAATYLDPFVAAVKEEDSVMKPSQKYLLTDEITEADKVRDKYYMMIKKMVESQVEAPIDEIAAAAKTVKQLIKDYGIRVSAQIDQETGEVGQIVDDFENKCATEIATLGLTAYVKALKEQNEKVRSLIADRSAERAAKQVGQLRASRLATDAAYKNFVKFLEALALVNGEADYADYIAFLTDQITHYKREALGQKASSSSSSSPGSGTSSSTDDGGSSSTDDGGSSSGDDSGSSSGTDTGDSGLTSG